MAFVNMITLQPAKNIELLAPMITLCIDGGRKYKIRADDILDALEGDVSIDN
jgi:hypothetical protein